MLEAAHALFVAQGYGAVSMDGVARAAGVSKATLYAHFSSKDALFATIINDACRRNIAIDPFVQDRALDLHDTLAGMAERALTFILQPEVMAIHRVVIAESGRFPELGRAFYDNGPARFRQALAGWIAQQAEAGRLDVADPDRAADQFMGMLRSGVYLRATVGIAPVAGEVADTARAAAETFLRAFEHCR